MSSKLRISLSCLLLTSLLFTTNTLPMAADGFVDVEEGDKYYVAITYLKEQGIIDGYDDNTFRSSEDINRAEALKIITLATELFEEGEIEEPDGSIEEGEDRPFTDTPLSAWYTPYLEEAKDRGIINGYEDGSYKPDQTVKLVEALKIIQQAAEISDFPEITDENTFADAGVGFWYSEYVAYAKEHTLINVSASNGILPEQELTRGYLAEIIYRFLRRGEIEEFGKATFYGAAVQGNGTASGETFDMNLHTAAHKTLPFGTMVKATNLANGKSVNVKINDRGPYGYGRVIDLSSSAFEEIAWLGSGVIYVQIEVVESPA
ncbi:septal ring lytic transglycosylase RlpA family protein [Candidatus Peregrinibacteria bacterium]|jgi:rare lipoprotein A (peptidoglycan hydrolase)|nr:septal ring lytic transglycosylase RlpA family protein [Candidatus Peregrinibacteria bacterium]MBT7736998.1 septal ring lytic transglycosylase RlpA family protein [Candidatus Peregrinibacteria bacterium]